MLHITLATEQTNLTSLCERKTGNGLLKNLPIMQVKKLCADFSPLEINAIVQRDKSWRNYIGRSLICPHDKLDNILLVFLCVSVLKFTCQVTDLVPIVLLISSFPEPVMDLIQYLVDVVKLFLNFWRNLDFLQKSFITSIRDAISYKFGFYNMNLSSLFLHFSQK